MDLWASSVRSPGNVSVAGPRVINVWCFHVWRNVCIYCS